MFFNLNFLHSNIVQQTSFHINMFVCDIMNTVVCIFKLISSCQLKSARVIFKRLRYDICVILVYNVFSVSVCAHRYLYERVFIGFRSNFKWNFNYYILLKSFYVETIVNFCLILCLILCVCVCACVRDRQADREKRYLLHSLPCKMCFLFINVIT